MHGAFKYVPLVLKGLSFDSQTGYADGNTHERNFEKKGTFSSVANIARALSHNFGTRVGPSAHWKNNKGERDRLWEEHRSCVWRGIANTLQILTMQSCNMTILKIVLKIHFFLYLERYKRLVGNELAKQLLLAILCGALLKPLLTIGHYCAIFSCVLSTLWTLVLPSKWA